MEFLPTEWFTDKLSDWFDLNSCDESCDELLEQTIEEDAERTAETRRRILSDSDEAEIEKVDPKKIFAGPNLVKQIGAFIAIAVVILILVVLLSCLRICAGKKYGCFKFYMNMRSKIFYNALIRYNMTSFLKMFIATCTTLTLINFDEDEDLN